MKKKYNLLIPMAGHGSRFLKQGYVLPKPLITAGDRHIIDWSFESVDREECNLIFVVRRDHISKFSIDDVLRKKFGNDIEVFVAEEDTDGTVSSCLIAKTGIDNELPLIVYTLDVWFRPKFNPASVPLDLDGYLLTFKANNPAYSYAQKNIDGLVVKTAEKKLISQNAAAGIYYFKSGSLFIKYAEKMIEQEIRTNNEFYVCPLYNLLIADGLRVGTGEIDKMHVIGTPEEMEFFKRTTLNHFGKKPISICADHSGFEAKEKLKKVLDLHRIKYIDFGTYTDKDCDYSDYVPFCAKSVLEGASGYGVAFCKSGQGVNIAANKIKGIRSALIYDENAAEFAISHNAANFFAIPSKISSDKVLHGFVDTWLNTTFDGGRHMTRLKKIEDYENL